MQIIGVRRRTVEYIVPRYSLASQTEPTPARIALPDAESDPRRGWLGLACETKYSGMFNNYVNPCRTHSPRLCVQNLHKANIQVLSASF